MESSDHIPNLLEQNIQRLKHKYSQEMKDSPDNPIKICMKLVFDSATERDPNRRLELAHELSKFLTQSEGVVNLFLALIDFDTSSQKTTTHNQRFIAVSNIITCLPKICMSYSDYCENISRQLKPLLISDNDKYSNLACIIYKSMIESPHAKSASISKILLDPFFAPFTLSKCDIKLHEAIIAIHNLILNHLATDLFVGIFPSSFHILVKLFKTPSRLKSILKDILVSILNGIKPGPACCLLEQTLFHKTGIPQYARDNEEDELSLVVVPKSYATDEKTSPSQEYLKVIQLVTTYLLEETNNDLLTLEFFFHFKETMWSAKDLESRQLSAILIEPLLMQTVEEKSSKLDLLNIIATNTDKTLDLLIGILLNYVSFLKSNSEDSTYCNASINQSISSCFRILEILYLTIADEHDKKLLIDRCLPILIELRVIMNTKDDPTKKDLYESLESLYSKFEQNSKQTSNNDSNSFYSSKHLEYAEAIKDLNDNLVPVRVHALVKLKQMLLVNDEYTVSKIPQLYSVIEPSIANQEPYVFLACINLVAEMAVRKTEEILPRLVELYSCQELDLQYRINIGEVLVRLSKQMNETTPFYAQQVMNVLFEGCTDKEELMRMSSLINIGQICHNLSYSLSNYITEILHCIEGIFISDTIQVKCAAVDLLRTALMGLDKFKVESVQKEIKSIYNILKKLRQQTLDEKFCLQVDLALDEVDKLAKEMLGLDVERNIDDKLTKNIQILSLLD